MDISWTGSPVTLNERVTRLMHKVQDYAPRAEVHLIRKAFDFADKSHWGQKRASGEPYITHPLAVAELLSDFKVDLPSLLAALLHDTLEDTAATYLGLKQEFGTEVASLVQGVTKLARLENQSKIQKQAENFRKFVLALSDDIRILLVKLGDRLHNMRTLAYLPSEEARRRIALETLEIYCPLAERIGMNFFQSELEDLSFKELHPDAYETITNRIQHLHKLDKNTTNLVVEDLHTMLARSGVQAQVSGREKQPYSIWRKMQRKNISFEQLSDVIAFRILVNSVADCYQCLGLIHNEYFVIPGRFKDYISTPKPNSYQSLHTYVIGPNQRQIEIQIRTHAMQEVSEYGVAAHWQYKQGIRLKEGRQYRWVRGLLDVLEHAGGHDELIEDTKLEMFSDQVFCFTPSGDIIPLCRGATPVDFAYAVHSDIGNKCKGSKINGKLMPLRTELRNGDQVEIITSPHHKPSPTWERFVVTGKAKASIRRFIREKKQSQFAALGRSMLLKEIDFPIKQEVEINLEKALKHYDIPFVEDLYAQVGEGLLQARDVVRIMYPEAEEFAPNPTEPVFIKKPQRRGPASPQAEIKGLVTDMAVHCASCCHPIPGEKIMGVVTTGKSVSIHGHDCDIVKKFSKEQPERILDISWGKTYNTLYVARLFVTIANKTGSLGALTTTIGKHEADIRNIRITRRHYDFFDIILDVAVKNVAHLETVLASVRSNPIVNFVERV